MGCASSSSLRAPAPCSASAGELVLFYHITPIADPQRDAATLHTLCTQLGVCGRLRVCADGLNGTLSGARDSLAGLRAHIAHEYPHGHAIDWKMSPVETPHQLFRALSVRVTRSPPPTSTPPNLPLTPPPPPLTPPPPPPSTPRELVSLGVDPAEAPLSRRAGHVSPRGFHELIKKSAQGDIYKGNETQKPILLDVRNGYEWRIGRCEVGGVKFPLGGGVKSPYSVPYSVFCIVNNRHRQQPAMLMLNLFVCVPNADARFVALSVDTS